MGRIPAGPWGCLGLTLRELLKTMECHTDRVQTHDGKHFDALDVLPASCSKFPIAKFLKYESLKPNSLKLSSLKLRLLKL